MPHGFGHMQQACSRLDALSQGSISTCQQLSALWNVCLQRAGHVAEPSLCAKADDLC